MKKEKKEKNVEKVENMEEKVEVAEKKKTTETALICIVCVFLVALGYIVYEINNKTNENEPNNTQTEINENGENTITESNKDYDETHASIYYSYIYPTTTYTVYKNEKVTIDNLTDEFKLYNAINNMCELGETTKDTKEYDFYDLQERASKMYNSSVATLPNYLMDYADQVRSYILNDETYVVNNEGYGYGCHHGMSDYTMFDHIESDEDNIYLFDRTIVNFVTIGEGSSISKLDGSGTVLETTFDAKKAYEEYPDYFTDFVHTFKKVDGNIVYISSEPKNID